MEYQWKECVKKGLFGCRQWETKVDTYDFNDPAVREKLRNMGFVLSTMGKVLP